MVDEPDSQKPQTRPDQWLDVRIEGRIGLPEKSASPGNAEHGANPENSPKNATRSWRDWIKAWDAYSAFITAVATAFIAAFTIVLTYVSSQQRHIMQSQLTESAEEFVSTHRARVVFGDEKGVTMELVDIGNATRIAVHLRNDGHSTAYDLVVKASAVRRTARTTICSLQLFFAESCWWKTMTWDR